MSRDRSQYFARFPGRAAVLEAIQAVGTWTPAQMDAWARVNGGNANVYEALRWYVRKGRLTYTTNLWTVVPRKPRYSAASSQVRHGGR